MQEYYSVKIVGGRYNLPNHCACCMDNNPEKNIRVSTGDTSRRMNYFNFNVCTYCKKHILKATIIKIPKRAMAVLCLAGIVLMIIALFSDFSIDKLYEESIPNLFLLSILLITWLIEKVFLKSVKLKENCTCLTHPINSSIFNNYTTQEFHFTNLKYGTEFAKTNGVFIENEE
jgi:hypothetical protein